MELQDKTSQNGYGLFLLIFPLLYCQISGSESALTLWLGPAYCSTVVPHAGHGLTAHCDVFVLFSQHERAGDKFVTPCWKVESGLLSYGKPFLQKSTICL